MTRKLRPLHVWHVHHVSALEVFVVLAGDRPERYKQWPYTSVTARTEAEAISKVFMQQMAEAEPA